MKKLSIVFRSNRKLARSTWGKLPLSSLKNLQALTEAHGLSLAAGDLQLLNGQWYVTHGGLLRISQRQHCLGIRTVLEKRFSDPSLGRWVFKATVYKGPRSKGFVGYGDADPSNISPFVRGAEMRVAETRAVNRALRKAYGIGLCSVDELGWTPKVSPSQASRNGASAAETNVNGHSAPPRLRDRLCLLIRQHQLDANLVKAYASDSCGTPNLRDATREQIETFITNLSDWAVKDRPALLCKLNSYATPSEVTL